MFFNIQIVCGTKLIRDIFEMVLFTKHNVMDTRELRIGNYVAINGEIKAVDGICSEKEDHIQVRTSENKIKDVKLSDVKPIPLHGELLIKCCEFDEDGHYKIGIDHHQHYLKVEDGYIVLLN